MNFKIERDILDNKFTTQIVFDSYGSVDITPEKEQTLLENYPTKLTYSDINFTDKYEVDSDNNVVRNEVDGEEVTIALTNKDIPLGEEFVAKYEVSTSSIKDIEVGTLLNTKELVCEAKCKLFEEKIVEKLTELINEVKSKDNDFEDESPIDITI